MKFVVTLVAVLSLLALSNLAFAQTCVPGWQNSFQCDRNWQEQLYVNPDCSPYWSYIQYCNNGCSNGFCSGVTPSTSACSVSASLSNPSSIQSGDLASTTILFSNMGDTAGTVNVNAAMCMADGSNCFSISCSSSQIVVPAHSIAYDVCSSRNYVGYYPNNYPNYNTNYYPYSNYNYPYNMPYNYPYNNYYNGMFRIRVDLNGCNLATSMYTPQFQIQQYQSCTPGNTNNYQCSGNTRQVQYQNADCTNEWRYYETCANGCSNGVCSAATSTTVSTITTTVTPQPQYVLPDLTTIVIILGIIVLLIIFFMLLTDGISGRRKKYYNDYEEHWRFSERIAGLGKVFSKIVPRKSSVC